MILKILFSIALIIVFFISMFAIAGLIWILEIITGNRGK
jgi:hypothetical protein